MNRYRKCIGIVILLIISTISTLNNVSAAGTTHPVITPSYLYITNVLKGTEFGQNIFIDNLDEVDHIANLSIKGQIEDWVTFHKNETSATPLTSIFIDKNSYVPLYLSIKVPADTANGIYYGNISVYFETNTTNETGAQVRFGSEAPVQIQVTGEQNINVSVTSITVKDAEIGFPIINEIDCKNNGNVRKAPKIDIKYFLENNYVGNIAKSEDDLDPVLPGLTKTYTIFWDTSNLVSLGNYTAFFTVTINDTIIKQENKTFEVIKQGTYTRSGTLDNIRFQRQPEKGSVAVLNANFTNTGEIEIFAKFNVSVYLDGSILYKNSSDAIRIPIDSIAEFESTIPIQDDGDYVVKAQVYYYDTQNIISGETKEQELAFTIGSPAQFSIDLSVLVIALLIIVGIILIIYLIIQKKRSNIHNKTKEVTRNGRAPKKSTDSETSKGRIRIGRNKEKSPFKKHKKNNIKENETINKKNNLKEIETSIDDLEENN